MHWDRKLDGRLAHALMSIQAVKGVEIGLGFETARRPGSRVHDEIYFDEATTGYPAPHQHGRRHRGRHVAARRCACASLQADLDGAAALGRHRNQSRPRAIHERSDVCAIPAAGVIAEAVVAFVVADVFLEKFGGDSLEEIAATTRGICSDPAVLMRRERQ